MNYYEVEADNARFPNRWFLGEPRTTDGRELDAREFRYGKPYSGPLPDVVPIQQAGCPVAFTLAAFDMPVVSTQIANILSRVATGDIQRFPVTLGAGIGGYEIVNATHQVKCVDEVQSNVRKWGPDDHRRDLVGQYREFNPLVIDRNLTNGHQLFRLWGSPLELIVSDEVRNAISSLPELGVVFKRVSAD